VRSGGEEGDVGGDTAQRWRLRPVKLAARGVVFLWLHQVWPARSRGAEKEERGGKNQEMKVMFDLLCLLIMFLFNIVC
jgi:hypothetical protein